MGRSLVILLYFLYKDSALAVLIPLKTTDSGIETLLNLANALSLTVVELQEIEQLATDKKYIKKTIPKIDGSERIVYDLHPKLRRLQRRINNRFFKELIVWPYFLYGSIPNDNSNIDGAIKRDYVSCATKHCNAKSILKVDIKNFFDNIHKSLVRDVFERVLNFKSDALDYITQACCKDDFIVQGALTSSYIASLCLYDLEHKVVSRAEKKRIGLHSFS